MNDAAALDRRCVVARQQIDWVPYPLRVLTAGTRLVQTAALIAAQARRSLTPRPAGPASVA